MVRKKIVKKVVRRAKGGYVSQRAFTRSNSTIHINSPSGNAVKKSHSSGNATGYQTPYADWGSTADTEFLKILKRSGDMQTLYENDFFELYSWIYDNLPLAQSTILYTIDQIMSEGIGVQTDGENIDQLRTDALDFLDSTNSVEKTVSIFIQGLIYGNAFVTKSYDKLTPKIDRKIVDYYVENTRTFSDITSDSRGRTIYKQEGVESVNFKTTNKTKIWRGGESGSCVHFKFYPQSSRERWGRSMFRGTIGLCMTLYNALGDLATIIKRYASPVVLFKLDNLPTNSARRDEIMDEFDVELQDWGTRSEWIYDKNQLEISVLESKAATVKPEILSPIERHIIAAFALPRHYIMDVANRSVAEDLSKAFQLRVDALQKFYVNTFTNEILRPALIDMGHSEEDVKKIKFSFNKKPQIERDLFLKGQKVLMLANSGVFTIDELRSIEYGIGPKPKEENPNEQIDETQEEV